VKPISYVATKDAGRFFPFSTSRNTRCDFRSRIHLHRPHLAGELDEARYVVDVQPLTKQPALRTEYSAINNSLFRSGSGESRDGYRAIHGGEGRDNSRNT
jgi:hypothetical protein